MPGVPYPCPVTVGYRWYFDKYLLRVDWVDGELVGYSCLSDPRMTWDTGFGANVQTRTRCRDEAERYGQPADWKTRYPFTHRGDE